MNPSTSTLRNMYIHREAWLHDVAAKSLVARQWFDDQRAPHCPTHGEMDVA
jgi:hypothetical protein